MMKTIFYTLRSLLFYFGYSSSVILVGTLAPLFSIFLPRRLVMRCICLPWCHWAIWWARVSCGVRYRVIGRENIPDGPCVVIAKHQSAWETLFFQILFGPTATVLKRELLAVPFFGWGLKFFDPIGIDRADPIGALKVVVREGKDGLKEGRRVVIFPEGTRTLPGEVTAYSAGGAMLATKAGALVVPVALNSGDCWPRGTMIKRPGLISVVVGEPIDGTGLDTKALNAQTQEWIEARVAEIRQA